MNGIAPGVVRTPLWDGLEQDKITTAVSSKTERRVHRVVLARYSYRPPLAASDDLAGICAFLASSESITSPVR